MIKHRRYITKAIVFLGSMIAIGSSLVTSSDEQLLSIGIHNVGAPLAYMNNHQPSGLFPDIVTSIIKQTDALPHLQLLPYKRILEHTHNDKLDLFLLYQQNNAILSTKIINYNCLPRSLVTLDLYLYGTTQASVKNNPTVASHTALSHHKDHIIIDGKRYKNINLNTTESLFKSLASQRVDYVVASSLLNDFWQTKLNTTFSPIKSLGLGTIRVCYRLELESHSIFAQLKRQFSKPPSKAQLKAFETILTHYGISTDHSHSFLTEPPDP